MEAPPPQLRTHRTVASAVFVAATMVTAFSLVGIASLLGWLPERQKAALIPPDERKGPDEPAPRAPRDVLAPIQAGKHGDPLMPRYSTPQPPPPAPELAVPREPAREPMNTAAARPAPAPPVERAPAPAVAAAAVAATRAVAPETGRVAGISYRGQVYEVRVRFEDGSAQTFRYRNRPFFEPGDRVRLDGSILTPD